MLPQLNITMKPSFLSSCHLGMWHACATALSMHARRRAAAGSQRPRRDGRAPAERVGGDAARPARRRQLLQPHLLPGGREHARRALFHLRPSAAARPVRPPDHRLPWAPPSISGKVSLRAWSSVATTLFCSPETDTRPGRAKSDLFMVSSPLVTVRVLIHAQQIFVLRLFNTLTNVHVTAERDLYTASLPASCCGCSGTEASRRSSPRRCTGRQEGRSSCRRPSSSSSSSGRGRHGERSLGRLRVRRHR